MGQGRCVVGLVFVVVGCVLGAEALGAGRVELILVADRHAPLVAQQTWVRELGEAGIRRVRLRQKRSSDRPGIAVRGTKDSPLYVVTGVLDSRGQIVLPGGRFRSGEARRIAHWLEDVARRGPPESRERVGAFGLPRSQMAAVLADLARPIDFSTRGQPRGKVIRKIAGLLKLPVRMDETLLATAGDDPLAEELKGLSCGTGLACALRPAGMALVPRMSATGPEYLVTTARGRRETWPVGRKPSKRISEILPKLFERATISLENIPIAKVISAIEKRLEAPILVDHAALVRHGVDIQQPVNVPRRRTMYDTVLDQALYQARLKHELRADEAGRPFVWVTTVKQ
jgi:hypothetical protein